MAKRASRVVQKGFLSPIIRMDLSSYANWNSILHGFSRAGNRAMAEFLNNLAFAGKNAMQEKIRRSMTIRTPLNPFFSVKKAPKTGADQIQSSVSTLAVKGAGAPKTRFTGWAEQELGTHQIRERSHSIESRGGSTLKKIKQNYRVNPKTKFISMKDMNQKIKQAPYNQRTAKFLTFLRAAKHKKPFILPANSSGKKPISHGLYVFKGRQPKNHKSGKMTRLIDFSQKPDQPRRISIMKEPLRKLLTPAFLARTYVNSLKYEARRSGLSSCLRFFL